MIACEAKGHLPHGRTDMRAASCYCHQGGGTSWDCKVVSPRLFVVSKRGGEGGGSSSSPPIFHRQHRQAFAFHQQLCGGSNGERRGEEKSWSPILSHPIPSPPSMMRSLLWYIPPSGGNGW